MILDIHTHHPAPDSDAIISIVPDKFCPLEGQLYSVGIHPWSISEMTDGTLSRLEELAQRPGVVAIGETGFDMTHENPAPMFRQINIFRHHVMLSESLHKPLIIHDVKMHDVILSLYKELGPSQPWIIHGFRNKLSVLQMFERLNGDINASEPSGIYFSFGARFNADTLRACPLSRILAETDESPLSIREIIASLSAARDMDLLPLVADNTARILRR